MKKIPTLLLLICLSIFVSGQNIYQADTLYMDITVQQADTLIQAHTADTNFIIIDVRTPAEYNNGFIEDAININYYAASFSATIDTLDRNKIYLVYCASGSRSAKARDTMIVKHFVTVYNMLGGTSAWVGAGYTLNFPTETTESFLDDPMHIFPNPVTDRFLIDGLENNYCSGEIHIYNSAGKLCLSTNSPDNAPIDISDLPPGVYSVRILTCDTSFTQKIIKL